MFESALEADGVVKRYARSRAPALAGFDLRLAPATVTGLVGPNGAGKSTLIKAWTGFEPPSRGTVHVLGIDPQRNRPAALSQIGYVPQAPSVFRELTADEHVDLAASLRPTFDKAYARERLDRLAIPRKVQGRALSVGQQAQLVLALALATRAEVLLLDEPTASLDPLACREFLRLLVDSVRLEGRTAVLSSHVVSDIAQACDHLVVLGTGHKLLDESIVRALGRHGIVAGQDGGPGAIATFPAADGQQLTLVHRADGEAGDRASEPATLEQIVLGYLAAGRSGAQSDVLAARAATDGGLPADPEVSADARPVTLADAAILDALAEGLDAAALIERHPGLTQAAIRAACRRAADRARSVGSASPGADR